MYRMITLHCVVKNHSVLKLYIIKQVIGCFDYVCPSTLNFFLKRKNIPGR